MLGTVTTPRMLRPIPPAEAARASLLSRDMRPLSWIAPGLLLLAIDMRVAAFDLLPDPLGWVLILIGIWRIARPATVAAVGLATAASFADVLLPYRWTYVDPATGTVVDEVTAIRLGYPELLVFDKLSGLRLGFVVLALATAALATWMVLRDLSHRARAAGRSSAARQLGLLWSLVPGLWIAPHLLAAIAALVAGGSYDPVWNHNMEYVALLGLVPVTWLAVLTILERDHAWALHTESPHPPPWLPRSRGRAPTGPTT